MTKKQNCHVMSLEHLYQKIYYNIIFIHLKGLKQSQNKKGRKFVSAAPKMVSFLQLAAEKKTPFLVQLTQIFGPSYFVRALLILL